MIDPKIIRDFKSVVPNVDFWSLRLVVDSSESLRVRAGIVQPPSFKQSRGAHITLQRGEGVAYAATSQLTTTGFKHAIEQATRWLDSSHRHGLFSVKDVPRPSVSGSYRTPVVEAWESKGLREKLDLLQRCSRQLQISDHIVDSQAYLGKREVFTLLITSDGIEIDQHFYYIYPGFEAVANKGAQTQIRSGGGWGTAHQGGLEQLSSFDYPRAAQFVAEEALTLLDAPECPTDNMSLLLMPSQMMLQIHESIGHPLELDRILGDERNYAGTSFVTPDMFGSYQYGSELLNVTFDPGIANEVSSYAFDDDGTPAVRDHLIRDGVLIKPLGGVVSQTRANMQGVANARACDWNRPSMDRMANLNLEPGNGSFNELLATIEYGVLMANNVSWSIDDSRNKFQFGCELGRIIKDGQIQGVVRNPNYRGISANFWRNLAAVGNQETFEVWGVMNCGKGEPNQTVQVGHASPPCVFHQVDVFGGA